MLIPFGRGLVCHHYPLESEAKLQKSRLSEICAQPSRIFEIVVASKLSMAQALDHFFQFLALELPGVHNDKGSAGSLGQFDEILPTLSGIVAGLPHDRLYLFMVDVPGKATDTMAFDEGHHVVLQGSQ